MLVPVVIVPVVPVVAAIPIAAAVVPMTPIVAAVIIPITAAMVRVRIAAIRPRAAIPLAGHRHRAGQQRNEERTDCQAFHTGPPGTPYQLQVRRSFALLC
jgi:hypothetical protein